MAENLAHQLGVPFLVWSVKQLTESIKLCFDNPESLPIYLSHPVSEPRRERDENGDWPEFTYEVNQLQQVLCEHGITLIMPTGIDELRFHLQEGRYTGYLKDRWPLIDNETELLYAFLQVLVREIESQIAWRDLLFIYHTEGLMVFRPFYAREPKATFSGGVDAEVGLWEDLSQLGSKKRAVFIHFEEDVKLMFEAKRERIWKEFVYAVWDLLHKKYNIKDRDIVENMVQNRGDISEVEKILNRSNITQRDKEVLRSEFLEIWHQGKIYLLKKYLISAVNVKEEKLIGIWILKDFEQLKKESVNIANFLRNGGQSGNNWEEQIENLFPDNFINEEV
jgi:hypothetical protein